MFGVAFAPNAGATATVTNERLAGTNRYGTAAAIAADEAFAAPTHVVIATGLNFPDALASSTLTGSNGNAPIILTDTNTLSPEASTALDGLRTKNVVSAFIVGGTAAVSSAVQTAVAAKGFTVSRVAGTNRYETAAAIATAADGRQDSGAVGGNKTALIATGTNFPDALAGGPAAHRNDLPLLLVDSTVPASTKSALTSLGITRAIILGGTAAVSEAVATEIGTIVGTAPTRLAGTNRFSTAAAIGNYEITTLAFPATAAILATGLNFPDALAGGPLGGQLGAPIVLTASLPEESRAFLDAHSNTIAKLYVLGGTAAIDEATVAAATAAAQTISNDTGTNRTATNRPELVSASIVETRIDGAATATRPGGTYVRYCFDEAITGATIAAGSFKLYSSNGTVFVGDTVANATPGQTFTSGVATDDNKCAEVIFGSDDNALDTAAEAAALTLATVVRGAVTGAAGAATDTNPEGDAALTPASGTATAAAAGITAGPDLLSVGPFRAGSTADVTSVDFVFDEAATVQTATGGFHIVDSDGNVRLCTGSTTPANTAPSGLAAPGGSGTTTITVSCQEPTGFVGNFGVGNFARGYVDPGTVQDAGAVPNVLTAADVTGGTTGTTTNPDLMAVLFQPDALLGSDVAAFVFDEAVTSTVTTGGFRIYDTAANEVAPNICSRSSQSNSTVVCLFNDNALSGANFVGGNVRDGSVTGADIATTNGGLNAADEEGTAPSSGPTTTAGRTDGPDLTSVAIGATGAVTYTFDEDFGDTITVPNLAKFHLYTADGIRLDCTSLSSGFGNAQDNVVLGARDEAADNTVVCTNYDVAGTGAGTIAGGAATTAQIRSAVLGTVEVAAVTDEAGANTNPEGAELTTGGTGTPA